MHVQSGMSLNLTVRKQSRTFYSWINRVSTICVHTFDNYNNCKHVRVVYVGWSMKVQLCFRNCFKISMTLDIDIKRVTCCDKCFKYFKNVEQFLFY